MIEKETNEYKEGANLVIYYTKKQNRHYGTESIKAMINYVTKEFNYT